MPISSGPLALRRRAYSPRRTSILQDRCRYGPSVGAGLQHRWLTASRGSSAALTAGRATVLPGGISMTTASRAARTRPQTKSAPAPRSETVAADKAASRPQQRQGAIATDQDARRKLAARLRRIEGQVRGLERMVDEGRYCPEILQQVDAVQASLGSFAETLLAA